MINTNIINLNDQCQNSNQNEISKNNNQQFKYRITHELSPRSLYRLEMQPTQSKQKVLKAIKKQVIEDDIVNACKTNSNPYVDNTNEIDKLGGYDACAYQLAKSPIKQNKEISSQTKKFLEKNLYAIENNEMETTNPPGFRSEAEYRTVKPRNPLLHLNKNELDSIESDLNTPITAHSINDLPILFKAHRMMKNTEKLTKKDDYFEPVSIHDSEDVQKQQKEISKMKNEQNVHKFLPDHVPKYIRNMQYEQQIPTMQTLGDVPICNEIIPFSSFNRPKTSYGSRKFKNNCRNEVSKNDEFSFVKYNDYAKEEIEIENLMKAYNQISKQLEDDKKKTIKKKIIKNTFV